MTGNNIYICPSCGETISLKRKKRHDEKRCKFHQRGIPHARDFRHRLRIIPKQLYEQYEDRLAKLLVQGRIPVQSPQGSETEKGE